MQTENAADYFEEEISHSHIRKAFCDEQRPRQPLPHLWSNIVL